MWNPNKACPSSQPAFGNEYTALILFSKGELDSDLRGSSVTHSDLFCWTVRLNIMTKRKWDFTLIVSNIKS